ncbi:MAG: DNA-3-methyladenine glycosylase [Bryobacterales bacterium]|nr:DNA-3-methyladenine glycosylase [Bryobacterales bacterium]
MSQGFSARTILPRAFYERDPVAVAREVLGALLVHRLDGETRVGRIVETEAYVTEYQGEPDRAAHAHRGLTPRTRVLFGPGGHAYVYFIYGMYDCLNLVAEPPGTPGCVLVRALEPVSGVAASCSGPGRLTRAMGITRAHYGADLTSRRSALTLHAGEPAADAAIGVSGRIGIRHGADWPLRFYLRGNTSVSG